MTTRGLPESSTLNYPWMQLLMPGMILMILIPVHMSKRQSHHSFIGMLWICESHPFWISFRLHYCTGLFVFINQDKLPDFQFQNFVAKLNSSSLWDLFSLAALITTKLINFPFPVFGAIQHMVLLKCFAVILASQCQWKHS